MTYFVLCWFLLFQAKPVSVQIADEHAIRANYAQWQQAYTQKRTQLIAKLLTPRFYLKDVDGEISDRKDFLKGWVGEDMKSSNPTSGKIVVHKMQPYGKQIRVVVDDGSWKHRDYWQKTNGIWKLSKRDMYGPSTAQWKEMKQDDKKK